VDVRGQCVGVWVRAGCDSAREWCSGYALPVRRVRAGGDSARAAPTSGGVSECAVDVRECYGYVFWTSLHHRVSGCWGGEAYRLGFPLTKKSVSILRVRG
jgi:hypothetical protein